MNKQQAQVEAAREILRTLVKDSPYTATYVAQQVGEEYTTFLHRLKGERKSYQQLDTALVVNILAVLDFPLSEFFTRVEERAAEILQSQE